MLDDSGKQVWYIVGGRPSTPLSNQEMGNRLHKLPIISWWHWYYAHLCFNFLAAPCCPIDGTTAAAGAIYRNLIIINYLIKLSLGQLSSAILSKIKGEQIAYIMLHYRTVAEDHVRIHAHYCQNIEDDRGIMRDIQGNRLHTFVDHIARATVKQKPSRNSINP